MKKNQITIRSSVAEYLTDVVFGGDQQDSIEMHYEDDNIWLTQKMMATLYDVDVRTINEVDETKLQGELKPIIRIATCREKFHDQQPECRGGQSDKTD